MELRQLPAKGDLPVRAEGVPQVRQGGGKLVGSFVEDHGASFPPETVQMLPTAFFVDGEESLKGKAPGGQAADGQGVHRRAAAGDGEHPHAVFRAQPHQILSGIRHSGGARVRHQGAGFPRQQPGEDGLSGGDVVVLVVADQRLFDVEVVQELDGHPGVLRGDEIRIFQGLHGSGGEVSQIADGGGHQIECAAHGMSSSVRK